MRIRLILTLLTAVLLAACGTNETARLLDDIESYIRQHPDSALNTLRSIDASHLGSEANRGHYSLLYAMALDKNYIDTTDMCNKQIYFRHFFAKLFRHFSHCFCDSSVLVYTWAFMVLEAALRSCFPLTVDSEVKIVFLFSSL